ncbi:MAG: Ig-like domain-containing protein [Clostridium sp.]
MLQNKTIKKITGLLLALFLIAGQFFVEGASVQAVGKQKALNITDLSLSVGQSQKLKVLNGKKVRWSSSKKTVASVSKKGVVKAKKKGKAVITAKAGKWKRKARITVKAKKKKDNSSGDNQNETKQPAETEKPVVTDRPDVTPLMVSQRKTGKDGGA